MCRIQYGEKEKILLTSIFSIYHNVFKSHLFLRSLKVGAKVLDKKLCAKVLDKN